MLTRARESRWKSQSAIPARMIRGTTSPITQWSLDFGDGTSANGTGPPPGAVSHTYSTPGSRTALLHVVDQNGAVGNDSVVVNVGPAPPTVWIQGDKPLGFDTLTEKFDASQSSAGNWTITFGDGTGKKTGTGTPPALLKHSYKRIGIFTTTLTVTDPTTGLSNVARAISTVSASRAPTAISKLPDVGATSAHLLADLWTNGKATTYHFEWGAGPDQLTNITPTRTARNGASSPSEPISGLTQGVQYYFRVVATNSVGTTNGATIAFSPTTGPRLTIATAKSVTSTSATLSGTVNPEGSATMAHFEWGLGATIDQVTPSVDLGSGRAKLPITATISGLAPSTTYSYRLVAANGVGQTATAVLTFTTKPA